MYTNISGANVIFLQPLHSGRFYLKLKWMFEVFKTTGGGGNGDDYKSNQATCWLIPTLFFPFS
jgi:hypothetical protein